MPLVKIRRIFFVGHSEPRFVVNVAGSILNWAPDKLPELLEDSVRAAHIYYLDLWMKAFSKCGAYGNAQKLSIILCIISYCKSKDWKYVYFWSGDWVSFGCVYTFQNISAVQCQAEGATVFAAADFHCQAISPLSGKRKRGKKNQNRRKNPPAGSADHCVGPSLGFALSYWKVTSQKIWVSSFLPLQICLRML